MSTQIIDQAGERLEVPDDSPAWWYPGSGRLPAALPKRAAVACDRSRSGGWAEISNARSARRHVLMQSDD